MKQHICVPVAIGGGPRWVQLCDEDVVAMY
jgi:hypothetical protein